MQYKNQFSTGLTEADGVTKNVSNSNLYKFFNDPIYQAKWGWILDYFISIDGTLHVERQSMALKGDGTYANYQLWNFIHFSATLYNFFNREHETLNYTAINFSPSSTSNLNYQKVALFSNSILIDIDDYQVTLK